MFFSCQCSLRFNYSCSYDSMCQKAKSLTMADTDFVAYLYPGVGTRGQDAAAFAIDMSGNKGRYVAQRRERRRLASPPPQPAHSRGERATTEELEDYDWLDYEACLEIRLDEIPKGSRGLEAGCDPKADIPLPNITGVSFRHFSLTFNDDYCFIVRDLKSQAGTSVIYGDKGGEPRCTEWIIGGDEFLQDEGPIVIKVTKLLQFRVVVKPYDRNSEAFRGKADKFRAGTGSMTLEESLDHVGIREPTLLQTAAKMPTNEDFLLQRKLGQGGFAVVSVVWNSRTGKQYALKMPVDNLANHHLKAWKNEALLMSRVSHDHIVKFLGSQDGPPPSLMLEYLSGGSLRDHVKAHKYFSRRECIHIMTQTTSALAYLHRLDPPITHRDISDSNILVDRRGPAGIVVKLGNLSLSKEGLRLNTIVSTPTFLPPEFFGERISNGARTVKRYTKAVDIWSLGAVIAKLAYGFPAYNDKYHNNGLLWCQDIRRRLGDHSTKKPDGLAPFLLETMLCMEPRSRWAAQDCHDRSLLLHASSRDTWKTKDMATPTAYEQEGERDENEEEATTVRPNDPHRNAANIPGIFADRGTGGVTANPGLDAHDISDRRDPVTSHSSATPRAFESSNVPSLLGAPPSKTQEILDGFDGASRFSESAPESAATVRPPGSAPQLRVNESGPSIAAAIVPRKRTR
ncbi:kinase-like domain-containing protein [Biscogniauxia marginata]|nr:kinase-like domain-containing protein [Biscogniauxia marginata]